MPPQDTLKNKTEEINDLQRDLRLEKEKVDILQNPHTPSNDSTMAQMAHTSMEFAMASLGFCVLGMIIALIAIAALKRCTQESEDYDVEVSADLPTSSSSRSKQTCSELRHLECEHCIRQ